MSSFHLKRAIVTGAGKGIGRAIALSLANKGCEVHAISRTQSDLDSLKTEIPDINVYNVDIANWDKTRSVVENIGPVDFLVNNAGVLLEEPFLDITKGQLDNLFDINLKAAFNISQMVAKQMVDRRQGGSIVNMSSVAGLHPAPNFSIYSISKAALDMLTRNMAVELGPHQIRVNSVNPGFVLTHMTSKTSHNKSEVQKWYTDTVPLRGLQNTEDVVKATMFLLSEESAMITGTILPVDGGFCTL